MLPARQAELLTHGGGDTGLQLHPAVPGAQKGTPPLFPAHPPRLPGTQLPLAEGWAGQVLARTRQVAAALWGSGSEPLQGAAMESPSGRPRRRAPGSPCQPLEGALEWAGQDHAPRPTREPSCPWILERRVKRGVTASPLPLRGALLLALGLFWLVPQPVTPESKFLLPAWPLPAGQLCGGWALQWGGRWEQVRARAWEGLLGSGWPRRAERPSHRPLGG